MCTLSSWRFFLFVNVDLNKSSQEIIVVSQLFMISLQEMHDNVKRRKYLGVLSLNDLNNYLLSHHQPDSSLYVILSKAVYLWLCNIYTLTLSTEKNISVKTNCTCTVINLCSPCSLIVISPTEKALQTQVKDLISVFDAQDTVMVFRTDTLRDVVKKVWVYIYMYRLNTQRS